MIIDVRTKEGRAELRRVYTTKRTTALLDYIDELEQEVKELNQHNEHLQWSLDQETGPQGDDA